MAYGALAFDLLVVPALLTKRFRGVACAVAICFHLLNACLFTIGVFPWFMLFTLPIYFPPGCLRQRFSGTPVETRTSDAGKSVVSKWVVALPLVFVTWQCAFPLRHFLISGNPSWTEEGHCFSWHMLLRGKESALRYVATDPRSGRQGAVNLRPYVTGFQLNRIARDPRLIHELAQHVGKDLRSQGFEQVELRALCLVSMNGRKPQLLIDPDIDLLNARLGWSKPTWTVPLSEPLRKPHWDVPIEKWESLLAR